MKFLLHGNAPHVSTGYGVQTALLAERLQAVGHDVAISCNYGQHGSLGSWKGMTLYPAGYHDGNDVIHHNAADHFRGDPRGGWIIPIIDVWALKNPFLKEFNIAAWTPVDHNPVPRDVLQFFLDTGARPIAMSKWGEDRLRSKGLDPFYIPLGVDTNVVKPTPVLNHNGHSVNARELFNLPLDAFVVGMVAMNKGAYRDRKGFNEAFHAFAAFWRKHPEAVLYVYTEKSGQAQGINLIELASHAGIPPHAIRWPDEFTYKTGIPSQMMAALYTSFDVLLAPSHGEGFCVPLIEAQACGTPVIASNFSAQTELVGTGWLVQGQPEWDPAQNAFYMVPYIEHIIDRLEEAYTADLVGMQEQTIGWALHYDVDTVFANYWLPFLASLERQSAPVPLEREPIPASDGAVAIVVPAMKRPQNVARLVESAKATTPEANVYFVCDPDDTDEIEAVQAAGANLILSQRGHTYATKANVALEHTSEPWIFLCGDDVEFTDGWLDEARKVSDRFDVIGTNDTREGVKNPLVASGEHSDHCLFRRSYIDTYGAALEGPGVLASEKYHHWFVDKEQVQLAQARGVFTPCLSAVVEHHHPGYQGREDLRAADHAYRLGQSHAAEDQRTYENRRPLIEMQRNR